MSEAAGFEVHDIGIDQSVNSFVEKVKEVKPHIVGTSGVLTLALEAMKDTVDGLKEAGLMDNVKIIVGGNPVTKEACGHIGRRCFHHKCSRGSKDSTELGLVRYKNFVII